MYKSQKHLYDKEKKEFQEKRKLNREIIKVLFPDKESQYNKYSVAGGYEKCEYCQEKIQKGEPIFSFWEFYAHPGCYEFVQSLNKSKFSDYHLLDTAVIKRANMV